MKYLVFLLVFVLIFSCTPSPEENERTASNTSDIEQNTLELGWRAAFNDGLRLDTLYIEEAVIIAEDGTVYEGQTSRMSYFKNLKEEVGDLQYGNVLFETTTARDISYQVGEFGSSNKSSYKYICIQEQNGLRALDFYAKADQDHQGNLEEIDVARAEWMRLCNQHNAAELVKQLYTDNAIYYNHKPVLTGFTSISKEYSYMNNPEYSLKLVPLIVQPVNPKIVFEIGQCSGSYNGKYVLVWEKEEKGTWKILLDSNV